ncbi:MAG: type I phosphomannose isomerase catalytic subunit [Phototrophicaceae bacterium]
MSELPPLYPLLLHPSLHVKVWGGRQLADVMGKNLPTAEPYGESWELHDSATVAEGMLAGRRLGNVLAQYGTALIGPGSDPAEGFPLLVKLLDAADWLSVQVHPDDAQAAELEGQPRGKTEAWYILAAEPDARLVIGVKPGTDRDEMAAAIRENRLEALLVYADIRAGDALYMPAGTVHAIGPGTLIYEVQQSSDTTYRLYDWGRPGLDGQPRPLHIDKGVRVSNTESLPRLSHTQRSGESEQRIIEGEFFTTVLHLLAPTAPADLDTGGDTFHALTCIEGRARVSTERVSVAMQKGQTVLVPAAVGAYSLAGQGQVLRSWQGE